MKREKSLKHSMRTICILISKGSLLHESGICVVEHIENDFTTYHIPTLEYDYLQLSRIYSSTSQIVPVIQWLQVSQCGVPTIVLKHRLSPRLGLSFLAIGQNSRTTGMATDGSMRIKSL